MMVYNSFEEELDAIRLAIYEEIKDLTVPLNWKYV